MQLLTVYVTEFGPERFAIGPVGCRLPYGLARYSTQEFASKEDAERWLSEDLAFWSDFNASVDNPKRDIHSDAINGRMSVSP